MRRLAQILFWSVISAAFIGPGTVTTAAKAGSAFGTALLWALLFSVGATYLLQETAARVVIGSGQQPGQLIGGGHRKRLAYGLFYAVAFGCAAYQAGNVMGAVAGLQLSAPVPGYVLSLGISALSATLLWGGSFKVITRGLSTLVAVMGFLFCWAAWQVRPSPGLLGSGLSPSLPSGSLLLTISLIGTTVVPYNLFLGAGLSRGRELKATRWGLGGAIALGGLISAAILITGTQVSEGFSFEGLAAALQRELGPWGRPALAVGLGAAGISSAITAPLAAAVAGQSLIGQEHGHWGTQGRYFRLTWGAVLGIGLLFSLSGIQPVPAIIMAQAINGLLLPLAAGFLIYVANDSAALGRNANGPLANFLSLLVFGVCVFLGLNNLAAALSKAIGLSGGALRSPAWLGLLSAAACLLMARWAFAKRAQP